MSHRHETQWIELGALPIWLGFVPSERAWKRTVKNIAKREKSPGIAREEYPSNPGMTTVITIGKGRRRVVLVTIGENQDAALRQNPIGGAGILVHEAMHAYQTVILAMGEEKASEEFEAHTVEHIFEQLAFAYEKTRQKIFNRREVRSVAKGTKKGSKPGKSGKKGMPC